MKHFKHLCMLLAAMLLSINVWGADVTLTFSSKYSSNTSLDGTEIDLDDNVSVTFAKGSGSNAPQYYTTGTAVRLYAKGTITVTPKNDATITGITLSFGSSDGSNAFTANVNTWTSPSWSGSSTSAIVLTEGGTSGNRRIAGITVTYTSSGSTETTV